MAKQQEPRKVDKIPEGYTKEVRNGKTVYVKRSGDVKPPEAKVVPPPTRKISTGKSTAKKSSTIKRIPDSKLPENTYQEDVVYLEEPQPAPIQKGQYLRSDLVQEFPGGLPKGYAQFRVPDLTTGGNYTKQKTVVVDSEGMPVQFDFQKNEYVRTGEPNIYQTMPAQADTPIQQQPLKENQQPTIYSNEPTRLRTQQYNAPILQTPKVNPASNVKIEGFNNLGSESKNETDADFLQRQAEKLSEPKDTTVTTPKLKNGGLVSKVKGYATGGNIGFNEFDATDVTNSGNSKKDPSNKGGGPAMKKGAGIAGVVGSAYYGSQIPKTEGDVAYNTTMQAVGQIGPVGKVIQGVSAVGDAIGGQVRKQTEAYDETGAYTSNDTARNVAGGIGTVLNPLKTATTVLPDKDVSGMAKVKALMGNTSDYYKEKEAKRFQKLAEEKAKVEEANIKSKQQQALAAREAGEENPSYYTPYNVGDVKYEKDGTIKTPLIEGMPTFKNGGLVNKVKGYSNGGQVKGQGGPKEDKVMAKVEEDSFIVPAENKEIAQGLRAKLLQTSPKKEANLNQKGGIKVKLSNGEHVFTPEEKEELLRRGVNVDLLAPKAENKVEKEYVKFPKIVGMKDGGELTANKARTILRDGTVRGNPLTDKQKRFFGAIAGGAEVKGYAEGGDVVDPKLEKSKIALEEALIKKLEAEKSRKATEAEKSRVKEEVKKSLTEDRKSKELKLAQELRDANTKLKALEKAYTDYSEAKSKPMTETEKKIGLQIEKDPSKIRADKKKILDDIEKAKKDALDIKKNYDFVRDDNNYIDGYLPKSSVKAPKIDTKKVTPDVPTKTEVKSTVVPAEATATKPITKTGSSKPSSGLASTIKFTPPEVVEKVEDEVIVPTQPDEKVLAKEKQDAATAEALNKSLPQDISQINTGGDGVGKKKGILDRIPTDVDPTLFLGPMQTYLGSKMLRGEKRPVFKPELDPRYNAAVERAQQEAKFGLTPEQRFLAEQNIENIKRDALAQGVNLSGGSGVQAYNLNRSALNDAWKNKLGLKQADLDARINKQRYADQMVADRANIVRSDRRQAFEDAMMGFQQRQKSGSELLGAGLSNMIGSYRFNKDLQEQRRRSDLDWSKNYGA